MNTTPIVTSIIDTVNNGGDTSTLLPADLHQTFEAIMLYQGEDTMHRGIKGLPRSSKALVDMGIFYIDGNKVKLHADIYAAVQAKQGRQDRFLAKLEKLANLN